MDRYKMTLGFREWHHNTTTSNNSELAHCHTSPEHLNISTAKIQRGGHGVDTSAPAKVTRTTGWRALAKELL